MTILEGGLLLVGLFGAPAALLAISHRFRDRGRRGRGTFWGGLTGYGVGIAVWVAAIFVPPVMWDPATLRLAGVVLPLAGLAVAGALAGALVGRTPRRGPKAPTGRVLKNSGDPRYGTTGPASRRIAEGIAVATSRRSNDEDGPVLP
ncbi:MAG: hypothetical protein RQ745_01230 [Longimicrobiales bacterium]|nr:hypothetical protein [Longimicrobiales bacterium]